MRLRALAASVVALAAACSSPPPAKAPEPTESDREVDGLVAEGSKLNEAGRYAEAADRFKSAVVIDPRRFDAQYDLAVALDNAKDWKAAAEAYERAIQLQPKHALAYRNLGEVRLALGDRALARRALETATALDPKDATAWIDLARVDVEDGHPDAATRGLERAVRELDEPDLWFHLGLARELAKDPRSAEAALEQTIKADPRHAKALNELGLLHAERRDVDGAIALWRRAVASDPRFAPAQKNLGVALFKDKGASYLALEPLRAYLELGGDDPKVRPWVDEIVAGSRTYRSLDRASAVFDRFEKNVLVTADQRFALRDAAVASKAKNLARGDRIRIFFDSPTGSSVVEVQPVGGGR